MPELAVVHALPLIREPAMFPLQAEQLVLTAAGQRLIDGLSLTITGGECTVILGPNGAGKSLLLRLLHGLLPPEEGTIRWGRGAGDWRRRQAMVFQRPVLLRRSVLANVRYALRQQGFRGAANRERAMAALADAGLSHLVHRPARLLSGGEQQRLAVARSLALEPAILFLDEPTASLDPHATQAIEGLLHKARADGTTVVLVTHDLGQARRLADRVVFLHRGQVAEVSQAEHFFRRPESREARAFCQGQLVL